VQASAAAAPAPQATELPHGVPASVGVLRSYANAVAATPAVDPVIAPAPAPKVAARKPVAGDAVIGTPVVKLSAAPVASEAPKAAATAARPLNVMTVNMEHHDRPFELQTIAALMKAEPTKTPDFIFCQEVLFERGRGKEDSTAAVLAKEMGYHVRGTKRTSDREGIAIVSKYPIEYYDAINLKSQTSRLLLGFRRVSTMAETTVPGVGRVRLVNVHFTNWGFETKVRREQLKETLEWAAKRERQAPAALTFLAGDFNAESDASEMALVKDRSVTGPLAFRGWNGTAPTRGPKGNPNVRIDFIFVSGPNLPAFGGEELLWTAGVPTPDGGSFYLSDHVAVMHKYVTAPATPAPAPKTVITAAPLAPAAD
jgi:endonuclease/exonuclease/phosphatase family metal-dependent hydrolase